MADKIEKVPKASPPEASEAKESKESYVSSQLALKTWSVIARSFHEGWGIVSLHKAWDSRNDELVLFPSYAGQDPEALKPDLWTAWRQELKPPLGGHTYIRDHARVAEAIPLQSAGALRLLEREYALNLPEATRRFESGKPGLVALVLRVYHLTRSYKFYDVAEKEGDGEFVPLPFDVDLEGSTPVVHDAEFDRRWARVKSILGRE